MITEFEGSRNMRKVKGMLVAIGVVVVLIATSWGVWVVVGEGERWLFFNEVIAEKYADAVLRGGLPETPDELIDVQISTYSGWVLFSPHEDDHGLVLAYAPGKEPDSLVTEGGARHWRQINDRWYELIHK